jgi:hypothetical protein
MDENTKIELLKHLHTKAREEIDFLRDRQYKIFIWSSNILLLLIGALLVIEKSKSTIWSQQGFWGKFISSLTDIIVALFSIKWQQRNRKWHEESAEIQHKIEHLFHCFDKGYFRESDDIPLYPEPWANSEDYHKRIRSSERIFRVNYISATLLLGILSIFMIWVTGN